MGKRHPPDPKTPQLSPLPVEEELKLLLDVAQPPSIDRNPIHLSVFLQSWTGSSQGGSSSPILSGQSTLFHPNGMFSDEEVLTFIPATFQLAQWRQTGGVCM